MTIIVADLVSRVGEEPGRQVMDKAKELLSQMILPQNITTVTINKYIRKAIQTRAWYGLPLESRVLLRLTRILPGVRSLVLKRILHQIFLVIELATFRGKAYFYGLIVAMQNPMYGLKELLKNKSRVLTLGIFYLHSPLHYRIYG